MYTTTSKDGTQIAYDKTGQGPALILVGGAFSSVILTPMYLVRRRDFALHAPHRGSYRINDKAKSSSNEEQKNLQNTVESTFIFASSASDTFGPSTQAT